MNKVIRESNIELLRIFSMLYIVIYHFFIHSIIPNSPENNYITTPIIAVLHIGVVCFILISGYWGIKFSINGFIRLFIQCSFYSIFIYLIYSIINPDHFTIKELLVNAIPTQWWFIQIYFCLYLLIPIINLPLDTKSTKKKLFYIVLLTIISFVFGQFIPSLSGGKNPINFILIYYIGNFIRYNISLDLTGKFKKVFLYYSILNAFIFFSILLSHNLPSLKFLLFHRLFFSYNSIGLILNASIFFILFSTFNFKSRIINWISISILPVYLLHENKYLSSYLYSFITSVQNETENKLVFAFYILGIGIVVLIGCVLIDKILNPIIKLLQNSLINSKPYNLFNNSITNHLQLSDKK
jgi:surface polysaccharide O-acyltransferase-like enzyme